MHENLSKHSSYVSGTEIYRTRGIRFVALHIHSSCYLKAPVYKGYTVFSLSIILQTSFRHSVSLSFRQHIRFSSVT